MARYWVGGSANWDGTAGTKWALTSGGSGGQAEPTNADDVFFDAASGAVTVSLAVQSPSCHNLDFSGFTGTFDTVNIGFTEIAGSLTLGSAMTMTARTSGTTTFTSSGAATITSNNITLPYSITMSGTGSLTLQDNLILAFGIAGGGSTRFNLFNGTFDANGHNMTVGNVQSSGSSNTRTLNLGSGTWTVVEPGSSTMWNLTLGSGVITLNHGNGTVIFAPTKLNPTVITNGQQPFNAFYNVQVKNTYKGVFRWPSLEVIYFSGNLKIDPGCFIKSGILDITSSLTLKGTATTGYIDMDTVTLSSSVNHVVFDCDYLILKSSVGEADNNFTDFTFYAGSHSVNNGSNTGWVFADATLLTNNDNTISNPLIPQLVIV